MSAMPNPIPTPRLRSRQLAKRRSNTPPSRAKLVAMTSTAQPASRSSVRALPPRSIPKWLRMLVLAQRGSSIVTFSLVGLTLLVYGWTVYAQELWGRQYRQLEALQRQERQLTATNEALKQNLAQQAEQPESQLALPNPKQMIFMPSASPRPAPAPATAPATPLAPNRPLAY